MNYEKTRIYFSFHAKVGLVIASYNSRVYFSRNYLHELFTGVWIMMCGMFKLSDFIDT